jgi:hypothetical protein
MGAEAGVEAVSAAYDPRNPDAGGTMIDVAAVLGRSHAERGFKPYLAGCFLTAPRNRAYFDAYRAKARGETE